ncbi:hypothetical protein DFH06DRAFT_1438206 [Mycena polygramma]|nr:hypothetical protein DFH06DRAFT_1438206 [Mycena polygramma]
MRRAVHSAPTYVVARCGLSSPSPSARNTRSFPAPPLSSSTRRSRFLHYSASPTSLPLPLPLGHTSARRRTRSARRHPRLLDPERKDRGAADALSLWAGDNRRSNGNSVALGIFERRLRQLLVNHIDVVKAREGRISSVRSATMARMSSSRSDSGTGLRGSAVRRLFFCAERTKSYQTDAHYRGERETRYLRLFSSIVGADGAQCQLADTVPRQLPAQFWVGLHSLHLSIGASVWRDGEPARGEARGMQEPRALGERDVHHSFIEKPRLARVAGRLRARAFSMDVGARRAIFPALNSPFPLPLLSCSPCPAPDCAWTEYSLCINRCVGLVRTEGSRIAERRPEVSPVQNADSFHCRFQSAPPTLVSSALCASLLRPVLSPAVANLANLCRRTWRAAILLERHPPAICVASFTARYSPSHNTSSLTNDDETHCSNGGGTWSIYSLSSFPLAKVKVTSHPRHRFPFPSLSAPQLDAFLAPIHSAPLILGGRVDPLPLIDPERKDRGMADARPGSALDQRHREQTCSTSSAGFVGSSRPRFGLVTVFTIAALQHVFADAAADEKALVGKLRLAPLATDRIDLLSSDADFGFDFFVNAKENDVGQGGKLVTASAASFPVVVGTSSAMTAGFLDAINGTLRTGMITENGGRFIMTELPPGSMTIFPMGSAHFQVMMEPIEFLSAFNSEDPGVLQVAQRFLGLSPDIVAATLGDLGIEDVQGLESSIPDNIAVGTDECLKRCGLTRPDQPTKQRQPRVSGNAFPYPTHKYSRTEAYH